MTPAILGVSFSPQLAGIALLRGETLLEWHTCRITQEKPLEASLRALIEKYQVKAITMKALAKRQCTHQMLAYVAKVRKIAQTYNIILYLYGMDTLIESFVPGHATQLALMTHLANRFPELKAKYHSERANSNSYHAKMFEAVACAWLYRISLS